jgi:ABC-type uncharacterized transport system involved in gliding motility auxiliary subunit
MNPIVKDFRQMAKFKMARPLTENKDVPKAAKVTVLAQTSPNAFALPRKAVIGQSQLKVDPSKTPPATQTLMMVATFPTNATAPTPAPGDKNKDKKPPETRVVVVGDADWISTGLYREYGNRDLALNTMNWLAESESQISIRPKEEGSTPMHMTDSDRNRLMLVHMILLPLFVLSGVLLAMRRQQS